MAFKQNALKIKAYENERNVIRKNLEMQSKSMFLENEGLKNEIDKIKKDYMIKNRSQQITEERLGAMNSQVKSLLEEQTNITEKLRKVI